MSHFVKLDCSGGLETFQALKATLTDTKPEEKERLALFVLEIIEQCDSGVQNELLSNDTVRQLTKDLPLPETKAKTPDIQVFVPPDFSELNYIKHIIERVIGSNQQS